MTDSTTIVAAQDPGMTDKLIRYSLFFIVMGLYTLPMPIPFLGWEGVKIMPIPGLDSYLFLLVVHEFSGLTVLAIPHRF